MERDVEMRIKLHNSFVKINRNYNLRFIFDDKIFLVSRGNSLLLFHRIDDCYYFLSFSPETKEFYVELLGFGKDEKDSNPDWWRSSKLIWEEMSKEG